MAYRDDLAALGARHEALATEVATKTRELDDARRLFDEAHARSKLPVLPNIRVATPCTADWTKMSGDERVRACGACSKNVYNLSGMTRDEAEALIVEKAGNLCVRYFQRTDGTIILKDCEIGVAQRRGRRMIAAGAAALLAGGGLFAHHALGRRSSSPAIVAEPDVITVQGGYELSQPPTEVTPLPPTSEVEITGKLAPMYEHATMGVLAVSRPPTVHPVKPVAHPTNAKPSKR
jgi:hypothetical protein